MEVKHHSQGTNFHLCSWYKAHDIDLKCWCSLTLIASYQADYTIYTDGPASAGTRNGSTEAVVTRESSVQPEMVTTIKTKIRTFTSSYKQEVDAMEAAAKQVPMPTILFCMDSKSLWESLISSNLRTYLFHNSMNSLSFSIFIQWIPGRSTILDNELADKTVKEATTIATTTILPIFYSPAPYR